MRYMINEWYTINSKLHKLSALWRRFKLRDDLYTFLHRHLTHLQHTHTRMQNQLHSTRTNKSMESQVAQSRQPSVNSHRLSQWEALGTSHF